jgi:ubiquinone/menaquinone biosynthesis C-methylase UbiE
VISENLLAKFLCPECRGPALTTSDAALTCAACGTAFPLREGRFPDFQNVEYKDESDASYQAWIDLMKCTDADDILEIGCGSGAMLKRLSARLRVGLEPAENLLIPSSGFTGVMATAQRLPFKDGSFSLILYKHALHHVEDKQKALEEAARVLAPGGRLVVIEPNADHPQRRLISNPKSWLRRSHVFSRFIGPVETFQPLSQLEESTKALGLHTERTLFKESDYDRLTVRQAIQRLYSRALRPFVAQKFLLPNYFASFLKPMERA